MARKTTPINPKNELPPPVDLPEIRSTNIPEIPSPPLPKRLIIGARIKAMEVFEIPTEEYSGVGHA